jgi:hypothetical protein
MYKLIMGNTRITVLSDNIKNNRAALAAREALAAAERKGNLLSHIEISLDESGNIQVNTTEKSHGKISRKTLKQSMLDGMSLAIQEKFFPSSGFTQKDIWYDNDTGQEWYGEECSLAREAIMKKFVEWIAEQKQNN